MSGVFILGGSDRIRSIKNPVAMVAYAACVGDGWTTVTPLMMPCNHLHSLAYYISRRPRRLFIQIRACMFA